MKNIFILLFLICINFQVQAQEIDNDYWSNSEIAKQVVATTFLVADWGQTRSIPYSQGYSEQNRILGRHPSEKRIDDYFMIVIPGQIIASNFLPRKYRNYLLDGTIAIEVIEVVHNHHIGLSIKF